MTTPRQLLLTEGLRLVYQRGFGSTSIQDIATAAGLPRSAFIANFPTKEAFGLAILEIFLSNSKATIAETLYNDALSPLDRLRAYLAKSLAHLARDGMRNGCLCGNLSAEGSEHSEILRQRIADILANDQRAVSFCLKAAADAGQLRARIECDEMASFFIASLQGAVLLCKAQRSEAPFKRFEQMIFSMLQ